MIESGTKEAEAFETVKNFIKEFRSPTLLTSGDIRITTFSVRLAKVNEAFKTLGFKHNDFIKVQDPNATNQSSMWITPKKLLELEFNGEKILFHNETNHDKIIEQLNARKEKESKGKKPESLSPKIAVFNFIKVALHGDEVVFTGNTDKVKSVHITESAEEFKTALTKLGYHDSFDFNSKDDWLVIKGETFNDIVKSAKQHDIEITPKFPQVNFRNAVEQMSKKIHKEIISR